jgi:hypothetical protein
MVEQDMTCALQATGGGAPQVIRCVEANGLRAPLQSNGQIVLFFKRLSSTL